jgi:hypothetical protein
MKPHFYDAFLAAAPAIHVQLSMVVPRFDLRMRLQHRRMSDGDIERRVWSYILTGVFRTM